ncbi:YebG family protein [Geopseudomonas aromaticivorans]
MAVLIRYCSSYDPETIFLDKNAADAHDRKIELAEALASVLSKAAPSLTEEQADELGLFMANNRETFGKAFTKKPELLATLFDAPAAEAPETAGAASQVTEPVADDAAPAPAVAASTPAEQVQTPDTSAIDNFSFNVNAA